jgi:hypothetical protein
MEDKFGMSVYCSIEVKLVACLLGTFVQTVIRAIGHALLVGLTQRHILRDR